jgi:acyl-CoA synthetase (AMP-forming)/AMP-acid ligase II
MSDNRQLLFERIRSRGQRETMVALESNVRLSGDQLSQRIDALAAFMRASGLLPGDRVVAIIVDRLLLSLLYLAALRARFVLVPVSVDIPALDLEYQLATSRPAVVIHDVALPFLEAKLDHIISLSLATALSLPTTVLELLQESHPDDLFSITFTSGTTARPKAVVHRAEHMLGNADAFNDFVGADNDTRLLHVMPSYYMAGILNSLLCPLIAGGAVIVSASFSPRSALSFWRTMIDNGVDTIWMSPTMAQSAMQLDRSADSRAYARERLRFAFVGTAPLYPHIAVAFAERYDTPLIQSYGLSELLLLSVDDPNAAHPGSIGRLLPGVRARIAANEELLITTPYAFAGYLDPETGALPPNPDDGQTEFATGDLARIDADGRLTITGRKKDLVIVGGINVSPAAVEQVLGAHPLVAHVAVVGAPDPLYGEKVIVFLTLVAGTDPAAALDAIRGHANSALPEIARPKHYVLRTELPLGPTGKIQKHKLLAELAS